MDKVESESFLSRAAGKAKIVGCGVIVGASTLGSAIGGGYLGYRGGEAISPEAHTTLGEIWEHAVEVAPSLGAAAIASAVGFFIGVWAVDPDGLPETLREGPR